MPHILCRVRYLSCIHIIMNRGTILHTVYNEITYATCIIGTTTVVFSMVYKCHLIHETTLYRIFQNYV